MNISPTILLLANVLTPTAVGGGIVYYLDHEYLTIQEYRLAGAEGNVQRLQEQIDSLQWDVDNGQANEKDKWLLKQKKKQLEEWKKQVIKIQEGRIAT